VALHRAAARPGPAQLRWTSLCLTPRPPPSAVAGTPRSPALRRRGPPHAPPPAPPHGRPCSALRRPRWDSLAAAGLGLTAGEPRAGGRAPPRRPERWPARAGEAGEGSGPGLPGMWGPAVTPLLFFCWLFRLKF